MKRLMLFSFIAFLILTGCLDEESLDTDPSLQLSFSADTVIFDTLLTARRSITKRLRIYNQNNGAVEISSLRLGKGNSSPFRFTANSFSGPGLKGLTISGGDSLLILVEVTIDPEDLSLPYLVKDSLVIRWNSNQEDIKLVAWGQDANFVDRQVLCDETWTSEKPYVITRDLLVDSLCTLTMEPGTKVYLDNGVRLLIAGSLLVRGDTANPVTIRNSRFDENYLEAPGQWDGVYFLEGSDANHIQHAIIENGQVGLRLGTPDADDDPDLIVQNTIIRHMSQSAVQAFTSDLAAINCLFFNSGNPLVFHAAGGNYSYEHCTIANSPNFFVTDEPAVLVADNLTLSNNQQLIEPLNISMKNCIIYGRNNQELLVSLVAPGQSNLNFNSNLITSEEEITGNLSSTEMNFPGFVSPARFKYRLDSLSVAIDASFNSSQAFDLEGRVRDDHPDIGAFEYQKNQ